MDNWLALFDGQTRYVLDIKDSSVKPDVLRVYGREALSEPFRWEIEFTSLQANILPEQVLMKYASLRMRGGKNVHGMVTRMEWLSTSRDQSHYRLTLSSRLAILGYTRQCAVFQNQSVPEVVEQVLRKHGLEGSDFEFRLARTYPSREIITQWRETDLQFIQRILSEVGIYWRTEMDDVRGLDTWILADSQLNDQFDVRLPYIEPSGLFDGAAESVWDVRTWHNIATGTVATRDYNYRTATAPMDAAVSVPNDGVTVGEHYRYSAPYRDAGDDASPEPETESGAFRARLHHERELNRSARIHLFSNASHLTPGQVLEPQGDVITALKEGVILTLVTFRGARDSRLHVSVWGMPYTERYCFRPPEIPRPVIPGTLPARIESREKNDIYAHLDEQGRYRVRLDFDREGTEPGYGYLWLRMAKPYAGDTLGWHTPLTDGTEVAIAYCKGDIDLPYIACALHDSEHPDLVNRDNHTRNVLRTPANNKLRMEDTRAEEHIKLATEYGKTQLNSGHLVDAQGQRRGKGTELRTDEWGILRAGKGLFVGSDTQAKAQGDALDIDAALKEIDRLSQQLKQLEMAAEQAQTLKADVDSQIQMFEQRLKPLNEAVLFSAPEGMALTSGENMQLAAGRNLAVNAGGDLSAGAMGNATLLTGKKLGLFARTGQLSLKSGEGPVDIQVQNAGMRLFAEKKLTLSSASDISLAGKKRITLIGGSSYLQLEAGKVEYGTTATYLRKVKRTMAAAPASIEPPVIQGAETNTKENESRLCDETPTCLEKKTSNIKRYLYSPFTFDTNVLFFDAMAKFMNSENTYHIVFVSEKHRQVFFRQLNEEEELNKAIIQVGINDQGGMDDAERVSKYYEDFRTFQSEREMYHFEPGEEGTVVHILGHGDAGDDRLAPSPYSESRDCKYPFEIIPQLQKMNLPVNSTIKLDFCWSAAGQKPEGNTKEELLAAFHAGTVSSLFNDTESSFYEDFIDELKVHMPDFCGELHGYMGTVLTYRKNAINEKNFTGKPHFVVAVAPDEEADEVFFRKSDMRVVKKYGDS